MGSGLILLIIVGAWLAVLVPMALRSHEASNALGTVDKFHDAMRVLSRRDGVARAARRGGRPPVADEDAASTGTAASTRTAAAAETRHGEARPGAVPGIGPVREPGARTDGADVDAPVATHRRSGAATARAATRTIRIGGHESNADEGRDTWRPTALSTVPFLRSDRRTRGADLTPAARRRRTLLVLSALVLVTLVGALAGPAWLLAPHVLADGLLVAFVVWLRRTAPARRARAARATPADRAAAAAPAPSRLVPPRHVAGIPDRMPSRSLLDGRCASVPAARTESVLPVVDGAEPPARGAQGEPWQPVPVPVPTYVNAPTAPQVSLERTRAQVRAEAEHSLGTADRGFELDDLLERRRAVGD